MILSILIPTVIGREKQFSRLKEFLQWQIDKLNLSEQVEIVSLCDNKEISIGEKRKRLYEMARGIYSVQIDDDDSIVVYFIELIMEALKQNPDCIGYVEAVNINGQHGIATHSNRFPDWQETEGYSYNRTIFFKDVIKTSIARQIGVSDMRYGEDHDFAKRLKSSGLLQKEVFIDRLMYIYCHITTEEHSTRYGIK